MCEYMKLLFATHNPGKLKEVREMLAPKYDVIGLHDLNDHEDIIEEFKSNNTEVENLIHLEFLEFFVHE